MGLLHGHALQIARRAPRSGVGDLAPPPRTARARLSRASAEKHGGRCPAGRPDIRPRERLPADTRWRPQSSAAWCWAAHSCRPSTGGSTSGTTTNDRRRESVCCAEQAVLAGAEPAAAVLDDRQRHPRGGGLDAAHRAAVRDHEDASLAGWRSEIRRNASQDPLLGAPPSTRRRTRRDRAPLRSAPPRFPSPSRAGRGRARSAARVVAHDLRRLAGTRKIAGVDRLELLAVELLGELLCLTPTVVAQRPVGVPLKTPLGVPVGLAVANEKQSRHDGLR